MPATPAAANETAVYRHRLIALRRRAIAALVAWWVLDEADLDGSFLRWLTMASVAVTGTQQVAARLSIAYVAGFVAAELGGEPHGAAGPAGVGETIDGRPVRAVLAPSLFTVKRRLAAGAPFEASSTAGRARAVRAATTEIDGTADRTLTAALVGDRRVAGWRRVTSGSACGACLGLADGDIEPPATPLLRHPHCRCTKEPVVDGVAEVLRRPTGRQLFDAKTPAAQDELFAGRGGHAKAELVRSGAVDLADLVSVDRQVLPGRPAVITEPGLDRLA